MPRERRLELIDVAHQFDCIVVEDNCYGDVHYEGDKEPALYGLDDSPNQVYICSLSKILGPGVRTGYLVARGPLLSRILDRRYDGGNSLLASSILAQFFRDNLWEHCAQTNAALKEKRDAVFAELERGLGDTCTWSRPRGGLFIWLTFPDHVDRRRLAMCATPPVPASTCAIQTFPAFDWRSACRRCRRFVTSYPCYASVFDSFRRKRRTACQGHRSISPLV